MMFYAEASKKNCAFADRKKTQKSKRNYEKEKKQKKSFDNLLL